MKFIRYTGLHSKAYLEEVPKVSKQLMKSMVLIWLPCLIVITCFGCEGVMEPYNEGTIISDEPEVEEIFEEVGEAGSPTTVSPIGVVYYIDYENGTIPIEDLPIGSKVFDPSWLWQFRTGSDYSPKAGDIKKPVMWIVVAKDHYSNHEPHITLISEEIIGFHIFDNSTDRGSTDDDNYQYSHNHWGKSGTTNAMNGLRPWLNSTGIHSGEGFYEAFSQNFKNAIIYTTLPSRNWEDGEEYYTEDKVFVPSTTELGDTLHEDTYQMGEAFDYFSGLDTNKRVASASQLPSLYWTRSPVTYSDKNLYYIVTDGSFNRYIGSAYSSKMGVRPALNIQADTLVSELKADSDQVLLVNGDYLRIRNGPGTDHEILERLMKGDKLTLIAIENEWLEVITYEGIRGWVHSDYVSNLTDFVFNGNVDQFGLAYPQPVGDSEESIKNFIEKATSPGVGGIVMLEFNHPNEINNDDLINLLTSNRLTPGYYEVNTGFIILGEDVQKTARLIFGPDIQEIEHKSVYPYDWVAEKNEYHIIGFNPGSYIETKVLSITEKENSFIVDSVHLIYEYDQHDITDEEYVSYVFSETVKWEDYDNYEEYLNAAIVLIGEQHRDGTIEKYLDRFPVRRYVLTKEDNDVCYIRQSYLLD